MYCPSFLSSFIFEVGPVWRLQPSYMFYNPYILPWDVFHRSFVVQVLIPIANGSEEIEIVTIVDILRRAKVDVVVASVERSTQIVASQGIKIIADKSISDAAESVYDLIILPVSQTKY